MAQARPVSIYVVEDRINFLTLYPGGITLTDRVAFKERDFVYLLTLQNM